MSSKRREKQVNSLRNEGDGGCSGTDLDVKDAWGEGGEVKRQDMSALEAECQFYRTILDHLISQAEKESVEEQVATPQFSVPSGLPSDVKKRVKHYRSGAKTCFKSISSKACPGDEQTAVKGHSEDYSFLLTLVEKLSCAVEKDIPEKFKLPKVPKTVTDMKEDFKRYRTNSTTIVEFLRGKKSESNKMCSIGCQTQCMEGIYQKPPAKIKTETRTTQTDNPTNSKSSSFVEKVRNFRHTDVDDEDECVGGVCREADLNRYIDQMEEQIFVQTCKISELERKLETANSVKEYELPNSKEKLNVQDTLPTYHQAVSSSMSQSSRQTKKDEDALIEVSKNIGRRVKSAHPRLQNMNDQTRTTKIGERYGLLYDTQWLEAFKFERQHMGKSERAAINDILEILQTIYQMCIRLSEEQLDEWRTCLQIDDQIPDHLASVNKQQGADIDKQLRSIQANTADKYLTEIRTNVLTNDVFSSFYGPEIDGVPEFMAHCIDLCWLFRTRDPPMELLFNIDRGMTYAKEYYKPYTTIGSKTDFLVWPALFMFHKGPLVQKGVLQPVPD